MDFANKRKSGDSGALVPKADNGDQPKYPSFRIEPGSSAYKELSKLKAGTKITLVGKFVIAGVGTRQDVDGGKDNYGNFVELELHSATKQSAGDNPNNSMRM